ncbi:MAG: hypothetical protein MI923_12175 [Phycisphaerales bacterium]|nr:hypothetical protein [Phycisphaerales bacterium]
MFDEPILTDLFDLISLAPSRLGYSITLLAFLFMVNYLLRTAYMNTGTCSRLVHMLVCTLTLLPAICLAFILFLAAYRHPDRAWINLAIAAALYLPWALGGAITRFARAETEGADVGWLTMGALITFPAGLIAAVLLGE